MKLAGASVIEWQGGMYGNAKLFSDVWYPAGKTIVANSLEVLDYFLSLKREDGSLEGENHFLVDKVCTHR